MNIDVQVPSATPKPTTENIPEVTEESETVSEFDGETTTISPVIFDNEAISALSVNKISGKLNGNY